METEEIERINKANDTLGSASPGTIFSLANLYYCVKTGVAKYVVREKGQRDIMLQDRIVPLTVQSRKILDAIATISLTIEGLVGSGELDRLVCFSDEKTKSCVFFFMNGGETIFLNSIAAFVLSGKCFEGFELKGDLQDE